MSGRFDRIKSLLGKDAMEKLKNSRVAVFGIGGVGGYVAEALARSGVGALDFIDNDTVAETNINRQIIALDSTIGRLKTEAAKVRILDINPDCRVTTWELFFMPETSDKMDFSVYDYVVDAIDTVTGKLSIICKAKEAGVPVISCMGTGNKTDATRLKVADIYDTSVCPLAKVMRKECRNKGIDRLKVVYSKEEPASALADDSDHTLANDSAQAASGNANPTAFPPKKPQSRHIPASAIFVPAAAGLIIAGEVVKDLIQYPGIPT